MPRNAGARSPGVPQRPVIELLCVSRQTRQSSRDPYRKAEVPLNRCYTVAVRWFSVPFFLPG